MIKKILVKLCAALAIIALLSLAVLVLAIFAAFSMGMGFTFGEACITSLLIGYAAFQIALKICEVKK